MNLEYKEIPCLLIRYFCIMTNVNYLYKISLLYDREVLFWDGFY
jgi:hypothetical protein